LLLVAATAACGPDIRPPLSSLHNGLDLPPTPKEAAYLKAIELLEKGSNSAAFSLLLEAARAGNTEALFTLGEFHEVRNPHGNEWQGSKDWKASRTY